MKKEINNALAVLKNGGVILYPTDTVWGLGCDATNEQAVAKINAIKGRTVNKSFIILLDTVNKLSGYVTEIPEVAYDLIEYADKPLTVVFSGAKNLTKSVINNDGSVGVRIVKHDFCRQLIQQFGKPIVSTSANVSGQAVPKFFDEIKEEILLKADYIVNLEKADKKIKNPSTIIKLDPGGQFTFIRK